MFRKGLRKDNATRFGQDHGSPKEGEKSSTHGGKVNRIPLMKNAGTGPRKSRQAARGERV